MDRAEQIKLIRDHIAQGERHVASQRAIVHRLTELGADTGLAEDILEEFETSLAEHWQHLAQMTDHET